MKRIVIAISVVGMAATQVSAEPKLAAPKKLVEGKVHEIGISATRVILANDRGDESELLAIDPRTGKKTVLYRTPQRLEAGACSDDGNLCVISEVTPSKARNTFSPDDPATLIWLEGKQVEPLRVKAFGDHPFTTTKSISPDGKFVVASVDHDLVALERKSGTTVVLATNTKKTDHSIALGSSDVVEWRRRDDELIAIVAKRGYGSENEMVASIAGGDRRADELLEWHVEKGGATTPATASTAGQPSPDGKHVATVDKDLWLSVAPEAPKSHGKLLVHAADCCTWLDNRYMLMWPRKAGLNYMVIDTVTMTMSELFVDEGKRAVAVPGTSRVLLFPFGGESAELAKLVP